MAQARSSATAGACPCGNETHLRTSADGTPGSSERTQSEHAHLLSRRPIQLPPPGRNDCGPGGRRGTIPYHTIRGRASAGQRARPGEAGGHRYCGTDVSRDLQRLKRWGHKDVHWSHAPPYSLRLSPPVPSHSPSPPRTSRTRPAPSKPRAPPGLNAEVAARARGRDRRGHRAGRLAGQRMAFVSTGASGSRAASLRHFSLS
jgi:hypothetical protein